MIISPAPISPVISASISIPVTPSASSIPPPTIPGAGWPPHVHPRGWCMRSLGDGVVHSNLATIQLSSIQSFSSLSSILDSLEVDEGKPPTTTTVSIQHHIHLLQVAKLPELLV